MWARLGSSTGTQTIWWRVHQAARVHKLVWFERHRDINEAILSEKRLKKWNRQWKLRLIEEVTPDWIDLFDQTMS
jgi:predicted GIY-YIG superfamily endonuclease